MKQWTEEELILLYYQELDPVRTRELNQAMAESNKEAIKLQGEYDALSKVLHRGLELEIPEPSEDLNQRIMSSIHAVESDKRRAQIVKPTIRERSNSAVTESIGQRVSRWLAVSPSNNLRPAFMVALFAVVGVFFLGRLSVEPVDTPIAVIAPPDTTEQIFRSSSDTGRRVLLTNVSSHLESSQRLLTLVSNGGDDLSIDIEPRRQIIEELISFNRLYRRLAEQSNDKVLANVLQQMESVLLEINHTQSTTDGAEWEKVRNRLDGTDLLFKLKVTDRKINRELT